MPDPSQARDAERASLFTAPTRQQLVHYLLAVVVAVLSSHNFGPFRFQSPIAVPPAAPPAPGPAPAPVPPPTVQPEKPREKPVTLDPLAAIGRIQFGNAGCTATIIGPRRGDGRWLVLTAAHCVRGQPEQGTMRLRDGRSFGIKRLAINPSADCCWCVTLTSGEQYPFTFVAKQSPPIGTKLWHAGYGVDKPGNREDGEVTGAPNGDGQIRMQLNVSSGDSGGGIVATATGEVISCVCCTAAKGRVAHVYGASPEAINKLRPTTESDEGCPVCPRSDS